VPSGGHGAERSERQLLRSRFVVEGAPRETVLVDAENVRRSRWPNLSREELVQLARRWAGANGKELVVVFDGRPPERAPDLVAGEPSADDWLAEHAAEYVPYWLVTSDRELRDRAGGEAERIVGGGTFLEMIVRSS
jgi:hypothetical protein